MNPNGDDLPDWQAKLKQDVGENLARFLDRKISNPPPRNSMFRARLEGIDRLDVVGAWEAAERRLAREQDREPRQHVMDLLNQRRKYLEEHGERPRELTTQWPHELPDRYRGGRDRHVPEKHVYVITDDGERVPYSERPTGVSAGRSFDHDRAVATDGGDSA